MKRKDNLGNIYDTYTSDDGTIFTTYYDKQGKELYTDIEYIYDMPNPDDSSEYYNGPWNNSDDVGGGDPYDSDS